MTNDKLRSVFEALGYEDVRSVISSGNIIFTAPEQDTSNLEAKIQKALHDTLGIPGGTIIRSEKEMQDFVATKPFGKREHGAVSYLTVTFIKKRSTHPSFTLPYDSGKGYTVLGYDKKADAVCTAVDTTTGKTVNFMGWIETQCGRDITTRTWKTVERITQKF
jgi:uncharacterized protein (DUF1697 family)